MTISFSTGHVPSVSQLSNTNITQPVSNNDILTYQSASSAWVNQPGGSASTVEITNNDDNIKFNLLYSKGAGSAQSLYVDETSSLPITINPNQGDFEVVDTLKIDQTRIGIGKGAGRVKQDEQAIAIGLKAGSFGQAVNAIAIGVDAGGEAQGGSAIAIGDNAGVAEQLRNAIAIGTKAGNKSQGGGTVAIGVNAGEKLQSKFAVAIGNQAGNAEQGNASIAIGAGAATINQPNAQIMINASGLATNGLLPNACYINTLRGVAHGLGVGVVKFDPFSKELTYSTD